MHYHSNIWDQYDILLKIFFINQKCIKLTKSDSKDSKVLKK